MAKKIIIDTDPGIDDAMAILAALRSPDLEVIGLTTVFGNTDVDNCSLNALRLLELEGNDHIPVAKGCAQALVIPTEELGTYVHGVDGLGNTNLPKPYGVLDPRHAAEFIIDSVKSNPGEVTLVPIGPLTNIGLALRLEPEIIRLVKEVVIMGGSVFETGNISPVAEANVYHDPHAADLVFGVEWEVTMVGLDVTHKTLIDTAYLSKLYAADNPAVKLLQTIHPCYQAFHNKIYGGNGSFHVHDPSVIAYLLAPELYTYKKMPIYVETEGKCIGKTVGDPHKQWGDRHETNVPLDVDAKGVLDLLFNLLTA